MSTRLYHPLLRTLLFFVLALAVSLPMPALAAPVRQATVVDEATLIGYYESEPIDDEGIEIIVGLAFYNDSTFELSLNIVQEEEFLSAAGEFAETDDGLVLNVLTVGDEPVEDGDEVALEVVWDADDSLVILGGPDGPLGQEDVILYFVEIEDEEVVIEVGGVYVSSVLPSEDGASVVHLLNLLPDDVASLSSDYLDLEPAIFELGTWVDNGDGTVTLEILGTVEGKYDESIVIDLVLGAYGELTVADIVLYPLIWLTTDVGEEEMTDDEEEAIGEGDLLAFVAEFVTPDDEAIVLYMLLFDDGSAVFYDEEEIDVVYGEWAVDDDGTLTVAVLGNEEEEFEEVVYLVLAADEDEDGVWVGVDYPTDIFGEDAPIFYPIDAAEIDLE